MPAEGDSHKKREKAEPSHEGVKEPSGGQAGRPNQQQWKRGDVRPPLLPAAKSDPVFSGDECLKQRGFGDGIPALVNHPAIFDHANREPRH